MMRTIKFSTAARVALMASVLAISACNRSATGQVVAVVNGEEISLNELNGELTADGAPKNGDPKTLRAAALQRLIDRKLLVQAAKTRGIDKDPDFLQRERRLHDELIVGMLGKRLTGNLAVPTQSEIAKFEAANPSMFAHRTIYSLDQIQFATPSDRERLKALQGAHSMDAVKAVLHQLGIEFTQQPAALDSAIVPAPLLAQVSALPAGEPFVVGGGNRIFVSVLTGKKEVPLSADDAQRLAVDRLRQQQVAGTAQSQVKQARNAAKIEYQPGYAPVTTKPAVAAKP